MGSVFTALGYVANTTQTSRSQLGIVVLMSFIPAAFAFVAAAVMMLASLAESVAMFWFWKPSEVMI
jgi:GPH family glycoside/pentoside/hexuronide:cation symporter